MAMDEISITWLNELAGSYVLSHKPEEGKTSKQTALEILQAQKEGFNDEEVEALARLLRLEGFGTDDEFPKPREKKLRDYMRDAPTKKDRHPISD